jgi:hypothetical protein
MRITIGFLNSFTAPVLQAICAIEESVRTGAPVAVN